jgi:hypothetical protein
MTQVQQPIDVISETRANFIPQPSGDNTTVFEAKAGDRLVFMTMTGETDVLEVLLTRRKTVVARALTGVSVMKEGEKYDMPKTFTGQWPVAEGCGQVSLFRKPVADQPSTDQPQPTTRTKPASGETKIAKCRAIFAANSTLDKAAMCQKFIDEAGCTKMGANTYYLLCKKG